MESEYRIFWSDEATRNLDDILDYLNSRWTERETSNFKIQLSKQLDVITKFPYMFPSSEQNPRLRKAVMSKQTIIFYEVKEEIVNIAYLFNSRQDPNQIS
jgi:plasmid stabilization system protein ParE